ncbi:MAG TPA: carboxymuconolactone decarboxylase family protein [Polyangiales bacterium]|nr:carboxymuconolactone decarboxylase family protein [Polyangiales bacterium]
MAMMKEQERFFYLDTDTDTDEDVTRGPETTKGCFELMREWDPRWSKKVRRFVQSTTGNSALDPKLVALIQLNLAVSPTHLHAPAVRRHIRNALRLGATRAEILEVMKIAAVIGIHSSALAAPLLHRELHKLGCEEEGSRTREGFAATPRTDAARAAGQFNPLWELMYQWEPTWLESFVDMGFSVWEAPVLPALWIELLCIAGDAEVTHMFAPGTQRHIQNALKLGATRAEILAVLQLAALVGIDACEVGIPILDEELKALEHPSATPAVARARDV